jgi:hypothetical protein
MTIFIVLIPISFMFLDAVWHGAVSRAVSRQKVQNPRQLHSQKGLQAHDAEPPSSGKKKLQLFTL